MVTLRTARFRRDHRFTAGHLSEYTDGGPAARGRARIERHLPDCPECAQALRSLQRLLTRLHELPAVSEAERPDIAAAVRRRLRESSPA